MTRRGLTPGRGVVLTLAALLTLTQPAQAAETARDPLAAYVRTRLAAATGDSAEAVRGYSEALALRPDDIGLALRAYEEALLTGDWNLALRASRRLEALEAPAAEAPILFLADALSRGDAQTAATRIDDLDRGPLDFLVPALRAWLAVRADEPFAPALATAEGSLARSYADGEQVPLAEAAASRDDRDDIANRGLARLLVRLARDARALDTPLDLPMLRAALRLDPASAYGAVLLAVRLDDAGRTDAAVESLAEVPGRAERARLDELATALLLRADRNDEAVSLAEQGANRRGAGWASVARLAEVQAATGRASDAAASFATALRDPRVDAAQRWRLLLGRGSALADAGAWAEAEPLLREAAAIAPDDALVLNNVGYAILENGRNPHEGAALIERAATLAPDDPAIADSLGWARYRTGDLPGALSQLERAAAARPGDVEINEHLGDVLWASGRRREARFAWRAATVEANADEIARLQAKIDDGPAR